MQLSQTFRGGGERVGRVAGWRAGWLGWLGWLGWVGRLGWLVGLAKAIGFDSRVAEERMSVSRMGANLNQ